MITPGLLVFTGIDRSTTEIWCRNNCAWIVVYLPIWGRGMKISLQFKKICGEMVRCVFCSSIVGGSGDAQNITIPYDPLC